MSGEGAVPSAASLGLPMLLAKKGVALVLYFDVHYNPIYD
jgi:hypothetical protein